MGSINTDCVKSNADGRGAQPWAAGAGACALETDCSGFTPSLATSRLGDFCVLVAFSIKCNNSFFTDVKHE